MWRKHILQTDDVDTQWRKMMAVLGVDISYALSPQAKGKVECPYRWLQDRIVRTCALEGIDNMDEARTVLFDEVDRYCHHQAHSTTGEIPAVRFHRELSQRNSLFRPFSVPSPYTSTDDVFCLRETRTTNGFRGISLINHENRVANVPLRREVDVNFVPNQAKGVMHVRIWFKQALPHTVDLPLDQVQSSLLS